VFPTLIDGFGSQEEGYWDGGVRALPVREMPQYRTDFIIVESSFERVTATPHMYPDCIGGLRF
jgi:hypothetical protein